MTRIMTDPTTSWTKPVEVFGYNDAVHFFGSIFEAETNCISAHNMGQVRSAALDWTDSEDSLIHISLPV